MADAENNRLTAIAAALLLNRMIDYSKNGHAELICKELEKCEPKFLAIFGIEDLLECEASRPAIFSILKTYIERRTVVCQPDQTLQQLIRDPMVADMIREYLKSTKP
jgi:hypothetical protein